MGKRVSRRSPLQMASSVPEEDEAPPKSTVLNKKKRTATTGYSASAVLFDLQTSPPNSQNQKTLSSTSELRDFVSSRLEDVKRNLIDRSHSEILKDLEASHSRLHKRYKIQTQACQQVMDEAEKEYKKMSERIANSREAMKASYEEFVADAQATASRACKTSISELSKSFEKAIDDLRSRFGTPVA
ncbi:hypothetical protein SLE2022_091980 [Rubroshorea leprosula]